MRSDVASELGELNSALAEYAATKNSTEHEEEIAHLEDVISRLNAELRQAQIRLNEATAKGSPLDRLRTVAISKDSLVGGIASGTVEALVDAVLIQKYDSDNRSAFDPVVIKSESVRFGNLKRLVNLRGSLYREFQRNGNVSEEAVSLLSGYKSHSISWL